MCVLLKCFLCGWRSHFLDPIPSIWWWASQYHSGVPQGCVMRSLPLYSCIRFYWQHWQTARQTLLKNGSSNQYKLEIWINRNLPLRLRGPIICTWLQSYPEGVLKLGQFSVFPDHPIWLIMSLVLFLLIYVSRVSLSFITWSELCLSRDFPHKNIIGYG